jgi:D-glycero-alpha-D-manno-heptose 1-phosphate guanylyltransferase
LREVIILAGGIGSRLQHMIPGLPKCMAPVNGRPFISIIIDYLVTQKTTHFIFSLGYLHEVIEVYLTTHYPTLNKTMVVETQPLGTGGAIAKALESATGNDVFVINGDTYFPVSLDEMEKLYHQNEADLVLVSTLLNKPYRYGTISFDENQRIHSFHEKRKLESGFINGGSYLISKQKLINESPGEIFSFETAILETKVADWAMYASVQEIPFIDIGIPKDYERARTILPS